MLMRDLFAVANLQVGLTPITVEKIESKAPSFTGIPEIMVVQYNLLFAVKFVKTGYIL